ncbi:cpw-wpc domain-containing protein [Toxoplasma gondii TgCatPRC2]|uniref:Cpw-wpc domain-containing protein n=12 Tax=Toxoplasma gondii TaxID=5811 RepID=S7UXM5_TOXGG|nr:cpw-wpc domain-containing protein [Toxoplasma gondii ME49]EPR62470.1 cpw-wpc domain-containing protein [Toxoplasma gondii GT1]KAF4640969.1 cpw-wpc domain-containing protein [Toxoplasma gondii]KFG34917.1 cpw-wpc domain-containing protein [Toxoplasma gondii p89]KFG52578.1 cpw-wpc domain-containing protein [Toxoplasma gondii FOU]KFG65568.1 cpw-wpc domain-containing protein [Toxoplasma gondii RUB]KFH10280.1 cpw-wpc domain-containing protein [Toxoplasma gondii VAND]KYF40766.1 cpw-wpc domain-co|eukprot:XP_018637156.1 cpw-wpc domain-containing protein [Toxoplasma gondii ME49]
MFKFAGSASPRFPCSQMLVNNLQRSSGFTAYSTFVKTMARCPVSYLFFGIIGRVAFSGTVGTANPVESHWPLEVHSLDATTGRLLNAFSRFLDDPTRESNQSQFTQELTDAALRIIYNVPPSLISQKVEAQTEAAARTMLLPNPDGEGCSARDYSLLCPDDFYDTGDGKSCKALPSYAGNCDKTQDLENATPMDKRAFAARCGANWPCREACSQEYSFLCPQGWANADGQCSAPHTYKGDCVRQKDFRHYDEPSKRKW